MKIPITLLILSLLIINSCQKSEESGPTACFQIQSNSQNTFEVGENISFTNCTLDAYGYAWDFGDGITSNLFEPSHSYSTPGTYTVKLTVNNQSSSNSSSITITITPSKWSNLGIGVNGNVKAMAVYKNELYVGGDFTIAGGIPSNFIAKWNGISWSTLANGVDGTVNDLEVYKDELYVVGRFKNVNGFQSFSAAKWNGDSWSTCFNRYNPLSNLAIFNGKLYAAGSDAQAAFEIIEWDGFSANPVNISNGCSGGYQIYGLGSDLTHLYISGYFPCGIPGFDFIRYNGTMSENSLELNSGAPFAFAQYNSQLYAGGNGDFVFSVWNGSGFNQLSTLNTFGAINVLTVFGPDLFAGGNFQTIAGVSSPYIARYDGVNWHKISGMTANVMAMVEFNGSLYVGGDFNISGGISTNHIAKFQ